MGAFNFPFRLFGGATRPDAISGMTQPFRNALTHLYAYAPTSVQKELGLTSAYRSRAIQQQLWDRSDKTGKTVARPGHSQHGFGRAADLYGFGMRRQPTVSDATRKWVHENAGKFGLTFPMNYEPWHVQLAKGAVNMGPVDTASANVRYDPRLDTPSYAHPIGSELPGPPPEATGTPPTPAQQSGEPDLGPPLDSEDSKKSLSGLMDMMKPPEVPPYELTPPPQAAGGPSLAEIIQQYIQQRMTGGQPGGQGGRGLGLPGGQGGQGFG